MYTKLAILSLLFAATLWTPFARANNNRLRPGIQRVSHTMPANRGRFANSNPQITPMKHTNGRAFSAPRNNPGYGYGFERRQQRRLQQ
jgi:hypothetical protein